MEYRSTNGKLWMFILRYGGLERDRDYWDSKLTINENRRRFRYLDRREGGNPFDTLAQEIGVMWPEYGIQDADGLWSWLQRSAT